MESQLMDSKPASRTGRSRYRTGRFCVTPLAGEAQLDSHKRRLGAMAIGFALAVTAAVPVDAAPVAINASWLGETGQWTDDTKWSSARYPNNGIDTFAVKIAPVPGLDTSIVRVGEADPKITVNSLEVRQSVLLLDGTLATVGDITNDNGYMQLGGPMTAGTADVGGHYDSRDGRLTIEKGSTMTAASVSTGLIKNEISVSGTLDVKGDVSVGGLDDSVMVHGGLMKVGGALQVASTIPGTSVKLDLGGRLVVTGDARFENLSIDKGDLVIGGILKGKAITVNNGTLDVRRVEVEPGSSVKVENSFFQIGVVGSAPPDYLQTGGATKLKGGLLRGGPIDLQGGLFTLDDATVKSTINMSKSARLEGNGTIGEVIANGGTVAPGLSIDRMGVTSYSQSSGVLEIEISSPTDFDRLDVLGKASFTGGHIIFDLIDDFLPKAGEVFQFVTAAELLDFTNIGFGFVGGFGKFDVRSSLGPNGSIELVALTDFRTPEPTIIALFCVCLAGMGFARRST